MQEIIPFVFEGYQIRVVRDENGDALFVGKDICEALGYTNPNKAMGDHCKGVTKRYPIVDSIGRTQQVRVLTEGDMYRLMTHSKLESAERFESLVFDEILPTIRKTGRYESKQEKVTAVDKARFDLSMKLSQACMADLNLAPSSRLGMYKQLGAAFGLPDVLPNYADDNNGAANGSMLAFSLTHLLKEFGSKVSAQQANDVLMGIGYLKEEHRKSTKTPDKTKAFKVITGDGLKYGKNSTSTSNPRESQPLWYKDTFQDLLSIIDGERIGRAA